VPENAQVSCMPIERLLREPIRLGCAIGALQLESRAMALSRATGSAMAVGRQSRLALATPLLQTAHTT
jgi:hypothetical protein